MSQLRELLPSRPVIVVARSRRIGDVPGLAAFLRDNQTTTVEVTLTTDNALEAIAELATLDVVVGAGTVTSRAQARDAVAAGAAFLVTPGVVKLAEFADVPIIMGAWTPTEVMRAEHLGACAVKVFPASSGGLDHLRALRAPFPQTQFVPSGGIAINNVDQWLAAGAAAVFIGSSLLASDDLEDVRFPRGQQ